jgi:hypothetical protein
MENYVFLKFGRLAFAASVILLASAALSILYSAISISLEELSQPSILSVAADVPMLVWQATKYYGVALAICMLAFEIIGVRKRASYTWFFGLMAPATYPVVMADPRGTLLFTVFVAIVGVALGRIYWLIAGRHAGLWREPAA